MKITNKLPQFENKKTLLIVTGGFSGLYFLASDGQIKEIFRTEESQQHYSDREGFFQRSGQGKVFGSGAVYEENKVEREKRFIKTILNETSRLNKEIDFDEIYLFTPDYISNQITKHFPKEVRQKFIKVFEGNYIHDHPFAILSRIKLDQDKFIGKKVPLKEEARKILTKYYLTRR